MKLKQTILTSKGKIFREISEKTNNADFIYPLCDQASTR